jgi:hypothetical protein
VNKPEITEGPGDEGASDEEDESSLGCDDPRYANGEQLVQLFEELLVDMGLGPLWLILQKVRRELASRVAPVTLALSPPGLPP